ncbi:MAG: prolipoprotein diacylglyceryl transferase [Alphaproteobacteria bacterium]|nr:prolipoprotein diacylglyceryl transferase [Alphaproteobacteria bacterium]
MDFPNIDPIIFQIGPFALRWYALAYVFGLVGAWRYGIWLAGRKPHMATPQQIDDFLVWATLGVILGGRIGYVLFYQPGYFFANPLEILQMWRGGMSFHGGLLGVATAMILFSRRRAIPLLGLSDIVAAAAPVGLFLGRLANFINGELWGRTTDLPWGVVFPRGGPLPRHPSQLYEAVLEGLVLFSILAVLVNVGRSRFRPGLTTGVFLIVYALSRILVETVREPDSYIGLLAFSTTWGQWLSLPMLALGLCLVWRARRRDPVR